MASVDSNSTSPNGKSPIHDNGTTALQAAAQRELTLLGTDSGAGGGAGGVSGDGTPWHVPVGNVTHYLSLRLDRPLEGCQLRPRVYVYSKLMTTTGIANKAYNNTNHSFEYLWSRGPERQVCSNAQCPRANSFSPLEWSKWALQGTRIQCVVCHKLRVPRHRSVFCNVTCFKEAWKDHQKHHATVRGQSRVIGKISAPFSLSPKK
ncbi:unnamed protein product, partial [Discosporangium mesarthrocarpum]